MSVEEPKCSLHLAGTDHADVVGEGANRVGYEGLLITYLARSEIGGPTPAPV
jgi:hypothetical protein